VASATVCIAGKNQIAVDVLRLARERGDWRLLVLPNAGDDGTDGWQPSLRREAERLAVEIVSIDEVMAEPELCFLSAEYDRLIRPDRFATKRLFNIHFSLLPRYRGCHTAIWPILSGEREHGVTLHWIDAGMDTGPIIDQRRFDLRPLTARDAYFRCMEEGASLIGEWLGQLVEGSPPAIPQDEAAASSYSRSALDFGRKELDPHGTVEQLQLTWRAFTFPEFQRPTLQGRAVTALEAAPAAQGRSSPGTLEMLDDGWHLLWASDGAVRLRF
jgi:methionyl-tRNA formyltransferase